MASALRYRPPAGPDGQFSDWLHALRNRCGVYVIRRRSNKQVLYVGESHTGRLAVTVKRHFWPLRDSADRPHYAYRRGEVEIAVRICPPSAAVGAQDRLIRRLKPRDNVQGYGPQAEPDPW